MAPAARLSLESFFLTWKKLFPFSATLQHSLNMIFQSALLGQYYSRAKRIKKVLLEGMWFSSFIIVLCSYLQHACFPSYQYGDWEIGPKSGTDNVVHVSTNANFDNLYPPNVLPPPPTAVDYFRVTSSFYGDPLREDVDQFYGYSFKRTGDFIHVRQLVLVKANKRLFSRRQMKPT